VPICLNLKIKVLFNKYFLKKQIEFVSLKKQIEFVSLKKANRICFFKKSKRQ